MSGIVRGGNVPKPPPLSVGQQPEPGSESFSTGVRTPDASGLRRRRTESTGASTQPDTSQQTRGTPTQFSALQSRNGNAPMQAQTRGPTTGLPPRSNAPLVIKDQQRFPDGSVRPDSLVAKPKLYGRYTDEGEKIKAGAAGAMYEHPTWQMNGMRQGAEPHTDAHMHPSNYIQQRMEMKLLVQLMNELGIRNTTLMPIPTSLLTIPDGPMKGGFAINPAALSLELAKRKKALAGQHQHHQAQQGESLPRPGHAAYEPAGLDPTHLENHFCGALDYYYVPAYIKERVEGQKQQQIDHLRNSGADVSKMSADMSIQDFVDNPDLLEEITSCNQLYPDTRVNNVLATTIKQALEDGDITQADLSRMDAMITGLNLGDLRAGHILLEELALNKGIFTGIGEITVHKELVQLLYGDQKSQASTIADAEHGNKLGGLVNLMEMAGVVGMPLTLHCDIDDLAEQIKELGKDQPIGGPDGDRDPVHFDGLKRLFQNPRLADTQIVWAHGGGLGRFVQQGPKHLDMIRQLLEECPNLNLDISWSEVAKQIISSPPELQDKWINFLNEHSDRICFGSDTLAPNDVKDPETGEVTTSAADKWNATKQMYTAILSRLDPVAKDNILNGTYERIFVASRAKVREFEEKVLTKDFMQNHISGLNAPSPIDPEVVKKAKQDAGISKPVHLSEVVLMPAFRGQPGSDSFSTGVSTPDAPDASGLRRRTEQQRSPDNPAQ